MSEELKPCPFCGGEARLDQRVTQSLWNSGDAVFSHVACDECDISGQDFCDDPDGEEAIEWWNRRAQPAVAEGVVERQRMIESMCLTWRHDFGLNKPEDCEFSSGMTVAEREHLRGQMAKLFDHHFGPALSAVTAERDRLQKKWARVESERDRLLSDNASLRGSCKALGEENKQLKHYCTA